MMIRYDISLMSCLFGLRASVETFSLSWTFPTSEHSARISRMRLAFPVTVLLCLPGHPGTSGASHVLRRLFSCMPRPEDTGGPAHPRLNGCSRTAFGVRQNPRRPHLAISKLYQHFRGRSSPYGLQDTLSTPRPFCSPCSKPRLRPGRKTRYGWVARPDPTGALIPCKRRQAFLGAITLALTCCRKRERSGGWRQSGAALG